MKTVAVCVCGLLATALAIHLALAANSEIQPATAAVPTTMPSGDAGTDLVVSFYKALLQEEPPTREQELALFAPLSVIRRGLVLGHGDPEDAQDIEPMTRTPAQRARRRLQQEKVAAAGPVLLTYFRSHKDWFLPKNMRANTGLQISSTYNFTHQVTRDMVHVKDPRKPGYGNVLVLFTDDTAAPPGKTRFRTIVFGFAGGRIDPDSIYLDGYQGKMAGEMYYDEVNKKNGQAQHQ